MQITQYMQITQNALKTFSLNAESDKKRFTKLEDKFLACFHKNFFSFSINLNIKTSNVSFLNLVHLF